MFSKRVFGRLGAVLLMSLAGSAAFEARAGDEVEAFRVYDWSTLGTADRDTSSTCKSINKAKNEIDWCTPRREIADVSNLDLPDDQEQGTAYRVFVDYCVRVDGSRERPVGAMTFRAAKSDDLGNVQRWGSRQYQKTARSRRRNPKPGREHFNPPNFRKEN